MCAGAGAAIAERRIPAAVKRGRRYLIACGKSARPDPANGTCPSDQQCASACGVAADGTGGAAAVGRTKRPAVKSALFGAVTTPVWPTIYDHCGGSDGNGQK